MPAPANAVRVVTTRQWLDADDNVLAETIQDQPVHPTTEGDVPIGMYL